MIYSRKLIDHFMKKMLLLVPVIMLLAAGCNSSSKPAVEENYTPSTQEPSDNNTNTDTTPAQSNANTPTGNTWQGTLQKSDNSVKGNYMMTVDGHAIYLNTSRDYSALVGKPVTVKYSGTLTSFGLVDITGQ